MASGASAAVINGKVRVTSRAPGTNVITIVYAESLDAPKTQPGVFTLTQKNKAFLPRVLAVPAGSTVQFPNEDQIFHNVFSLSRPSPFDLGLYRAGSSKSRVFAAPAVYRVFCNIHPQMTAVILVIPTSYFVEADAAGNYRLDLPNGRYRITAWSERAQQSSIELAVGGNAQPAELALDESQFAETGHKNKFGQDYPAQSYDSLRDSKPR